tara:strand:+ start:677 stop:934 length:258 start_codon:yes stop_codon:yes gene_type:complete
LQLVLLLLSALLAFTVLFSSLVAVATAEDSEVSTEVDAAVVVDVGSAAFVCVPSVLVLQPAANKRPATATKVLRNIFSPFCLFLS